MPESLIEATQQGWPKVAAFNVNKEELIRDWANEEVNGVSWLFSRDISQQSLQCFHDSESHHLHITQLPHPHPPQASASPAMK